MMGLTYQFERKDFHVISCEDLPDQRVKIVYNFDGDDGENILENMRQLLPFLGNLLGLDKDDPIERNTIKMLMYTDPLIFPLDEEGLQVSSIYKLDVSMFNI